MNTWDKHRVDVISNGQCLTAVIDLVDTYTISSENPAFEAARDAWREKDFERLINAIKPIEAIRQMSNVISGVEIRDNAVYYEGVQMHGVLINRILEFAREGFDYTSLVKFLYNLKQNPSRTAVEELYMFLESASTPMPITADGNFLAYKKVRSDYKDIYSGTVRYKVGDEPEMARNEVDDNRNQTCSYGLHFCSIGYLPSFGVCDPSGSKIVIVEINPKDVVSIPSDYSNTKGRACKMKVVGELTHEQYNKAIKGISIWKKGYVESEKVATLQTDFWTRKEARDFVRSHGGRVVDNRRVNNKWSVVGSTFNFSKNVVAPEYVPTPDLSTSAVSQPLISAFHSRKMARRFRNSQGRGKVFDTLKYPKYKTQHNHRWVVDINA